MKSQCCLKTLADNIDFMDSRLRGNDLTKMLDSSKSWNLTSLFVIVGLDPTIQKFSDNFILRSKCNFSLET
jgi:hypothetical protein